MIKIKMNLKPGFDRNAEIRALAEQVAAYVDPHSVRSTGPSQPPYPKDIRRDEHNYQLDQGNNWTLNASWEDNDEVRVSHRYFDMAKLAAVANMLAAFGPSWWAVSLQRGHETTPVRAKPDDAPPASKSEGA